MEGSQLSKHKPGSCPLYDKHVEFALGFIYVGGGRGLPKQEKEGGLSSAQIM